MDYTANFIFSKLVVLYQGITDFGFLFLVSFAFLYSGKFFIEIAFPVLAIGLQTREILTLFPSYIINVHCGKCLWALSKDLINSVGFTFGGLDGVERYRVP